MALRFRTVKSRRKLIIEVFKRDGGRCGLCGLRVPNPKNQHRREIPDILRATVDHIKPKCEGGTREKDNLRLAHALCNTLRGDCTTEQWADRLHTKHYREHLVKIVKAVKEWTTNSSAPSAAKTID